MMLIPHRLFWLLIPLLMIILGTCEYNLSLKELIPPGPVSPGLTPPPGGSRISNWAELKQKCAAAADGEVLTLIKDIDAIPGNVGDSDKGPIIIDKKITLVSWGGKKTISRSPEFKSVLFGVTGGGHLILGDSNIGIVLDGKGIIADGPLIRAEGSPGQSSSLTLANADIINGISKKSSTGSDDAENKYGGGVYLEKSKLIFNKGTISGNYTIAEVSGWAVAKSYGGGICAKDNSTITMNGGTISGNYAEATGPGNLAESRGGGVFADNYSTFNFKGGEISGNYSKATSTGGGSTAACAGGGVYAKDNSTITMNGGTISGNYAEASSSGNGAESYGGGVFANGSSGFSFMDGEISGNYSKAATNSSGSSAKSYGGGVFIEQVSSFSGKIISNNHAVAECTDASGGGNQAESQGGGIWVQGSGWFPTFALNGVIVSGNDCASTALGGGSTSTSQGGGIYITAVFLSSVSFTKVSGTTVSGNTAVTGSQMYLGSGARYGLLDYGPRSYDSPF